MSETNPEVPTFIKLRHFPILGGDEYYYSIPTEVWMIMHDHLVQNNYKLYDTTLRNLHRRYVKIRDSDEETKEYNKSLLRDFPVFFLQSLTEYYSNEQ